MQGSTEKPTFTCSVTLYYENLHERLLHLKANNNNLKSAKPERAKSAKLSRA
jgi:hypothetical protein